MSYEEKKYSGTGHPTTSGTNLSHFIDVTLDGTVVRDNQPVKISRICKNTIRIGCTKITIEAIRRVLYLAEKPLLLQEGAE